MQSKKLLLNLNIIKLKKKKKKDLYFRINFKSSLLRTYVSLIKSVKYYNKLLNLKDF